MFEMLTGTVPFDGESTVTIALKHIQSNVPNVKDFTRDVPVSLETHVKTTAAITNATIPTITPPIVTIRSAG